MPPQTEVRQAVPSDVHLIRKMIGSDDPEDYVLEELEKWIAGQEVYVAVTSGSITGMAHYQPMPDGTIWLSGLRVSGNMRRKGVGRILTRKMTSLPGYRIFRLMISCDNEPSLQLSIQEGFKRRCTISLWRRETGAKPAGLRETVVQAAEMDYLKNFDGLAPTAWFAFVPGNITPSSLKTLGLSYVTDEAGNLFLMNRTEKALTPLHAGREAFASIPQGYVLLAAGKEEPGRFGLRRTLWTERVGIFEYRREH